MNYPVFVQPPQKVALGLIPFYHAYGLAAVLTMGMLAGNKIIVLDKFKPRKFLEIIQKYRVRVDYFLL